MCASKMYRAESSIENEGGKGKECHIKKEREGGGEERRLRKCTRRSKDSMGYDK